MPSFSPFTFTLIYHVAGNFLRLSSRAPLTRISNSGFERDPSLFLPSILSLFITHVGGNFFLLQCSVATGSRDPHTHIHTSRARLGENVILGPTLSATLTSSSPRPRVATAKLHTQLIGSTLLIPSRERDSGIEKIGTPCVAFSDTRGEQLCNLLFAISVFTGGFADSLDSQFARPLQVGTLSTRARDKETKRKRERETPKVELNEI